MMRFLIIYLIYLATHEVEINAWDHGNYDKPRIMGGMDAQAGQFSWHVYLTVQNLNSKKFHCGGSLISSTWVLTAAHCLTGADSIKMKIGGISTNMINPEPASKMLTGRSFIIHKNFKKSSNERNDIALIKLDEPVEENEIIKYIRLPIESTKYLPNTTALVSGWGRTETGSPEILKYTKVHIIESSNCSNAYNNNFNENRIICCMGNTIETACNGDSGGPLIITEEDNIPTLIGVVSLGSHRYGCTNTLPTVYTKISSYLNWIHKYTDIQIRSNKE